MNVGTCSEWGKCRHCLQLREEGNRLSILEEVKGGESRWIEFKEKLPRSEQIAKTAIAFSNGGGGKLIIGVKDQIGEVAGVSKKRKHHGIRTCEMCTF
jgi:predicted HTH transcriptional regulator